MHTEEGTTSRKEVTVMVGEVGVVQEAATEGGAIGTAGGEDCAVRRDRLSFFETMDWDHQHIRDWYTE